MYSVIAMLKFGEIESATEYVVSRADLPTLIYEITYNPMFRLVSVLTTPETESTIRFSAGERVYRR